MSNLEEIDNMSNIFKMSYSQRVNINTMGINSGVEAGQHKKGYFEPHAQPQELDRFERLMYQNMRLYKCRR